MSTWMKILWAIPLVLMLVFLLPRAKQMLKDSPEAKPGDWNAILLPIALVIGFVAFLMWIN